jgi:hypothetical protein
MAEPGQAQATMEATVRGQAERLRAQLAELAGAAPLAVDGACLADVSAAARALRSALGQLPPEVRPLVAGAELGFMPGPSLDAFAPKHFQEWDKELGSLTEGCEAIGQWQGEAGRGARRDWLIRGYIRGFAHQWRQAGRGEPDTSTAGTAFCRFASRWLDEAGVTDQHHRRITAALGPRWRVASG